MQKIPVVQAHLAHRLPQFCSAIALALLILSPGYSHAAKKPAEDLFQPAVEATEDTFDQEPPKVQGSAIGYETPRKGSGPVIIEGKPTKRGGSGALMAAEPIVEGFADQVPLSVALQQVLPQGMTFSFSDGVNPGQLVSWRGGRPWQAVLRDMLGPTGLSFNVNDRLVVVSNPNSAPMVVGGGMPQGQQGYVPLAAPPNAMGAGGGLPPYQPGQMYAQDAAPQMMQPQPMVMPAPMPQAGMPPQAMMMPASAAGGPQPLQIQNPAIFQAQPWDARPGMTLRSVLQQWCARVGAELDWHAEFDYPVKASMNMTGTFEEAVRTLLSGFKDAKPVPYGRMH
ncbi:MAG TPA: TcpQ domain-containing protein, partial [Alphaproteobacteria bacterium]|nr:TcpQ domain-containing protein [Alphaproteobacteria bacterium]